MRSAFGHKKSRKVVHVTAEEAAAQKAKSEQIESKVVELQKRQFQDRQVLELAELLDVDDKRPNIVTDAEFSKYTPLFRKAPEFTTLEESTRFREAMDALGREYIHRFTAYKPVTVIRSTSDPVVIARYPQLFTAIAAPGLEDGDVARNVIAHKAMNSGIEAHVAQGMKMAVDSVTRAQLRGKTIESIKKARAQTAEILNEFAARKKGEVVPEGITSPGTDHNKTAETDLDGMDFILED